MKISYPLWLTIAAAAMLSVSARPLAAQTPPAPMGGGNMDPQQFQQQMQQRMMEFFRDRLAVTNDEEWSVIQGRLQKVVQARMQTFLGGLGGLRGMMGGGRGGDPQGGPRRGFGALAQPSPEAEALQKATETANASPDQLKAALARYREERKQKQAELAAAQDQLRQVLSLRQEAVLVSMGLLD